MKPTRASWGDLPDCASSGALAELRSKVGSLSHASCVFLCSMPARADESSAIHVDAYAAQLNAIEHMRAKPANWSAAPVAAPDAARTDAAQRGLIMLLLAGVPAPTLMLLNDGTVAAFWRRADAYASMDFDADGEFAWSAANAAGIASGTWTGGALPAPLHDMIGR